MARVLVTGASGFIGRHLVERLAEGGDEVRCLVREAPAWAPGLGVELARGDVTDRGSLDLAVRGVDVVHHLAGRTLALSGAEFHRVNAGGTGHLAASCASRTSPPTLVFVSSLAAAGPSVGDRSRTEEDEPAPVSEYGRSKWAAERALRPFAGSMPITVVRPPGVFGPRERYLLALFRSVAKGWNIVPVRGPLRMSLVHVADLVEALRQGAAQGSRLEPGGGSRGIYYVAFDRAPGYVELGELIASALARPSPRAVRLPSAVGFALAGASGLLAQLRRRPMLLNLDKMREAAAGSWTCDPSRAARELDFRPPRSLPERLGEVADWYRAEGWL